MASEPNFPGPADAEPLAAQLRDLQGLADSFGRAMTTAFRRSVVDGRALEDVLKSLALSLSAKGRTRGAIPLPRFAGEERTGRVRATPTEPFMKSFSPALAAHLASGVTTLCTCWRIFRAGGVMLGFTDHDLAIAFGGVDHEPESGLDASAATSNAGLQVAISWDSHFCEM